MSNNRHTTRSHQPQECIDRGGVEKKRHADDEQDAVELAGCDESAVREGQVAAVELADCPHSADDEEDQEEETEVGEEGIDAKHDEDGRIIAAEMTQVVVDTGLGFAKVLRFRNALEIEELG